MTGKRWKIQVKIYGFLIQLGLKLVLRLEKDGQVEVVAKLSSTRECPTKLAKVDHIY